MRTTIVSNFFLAAFLKLSMNHIIKLINALQIVSLNPLLNIQMPSNYLVFLQTIIELSNLKLVPKEVISWVFTNLLKKQYEDPMEEDDKSLSEQDYQMTFRNTDVLKSISGFLIMIGGFSFASLVIVGLARFTMLRYPKLNVRLVSIR